METGELMVNMKWEALAIQFLGVNDSGMEMFSERLYRYWICWQETSKIEIINNAGNYLDILQQISLIINH